MTSLSRALRRWQPTQIASAGLALAILLVLAAFVFAISSSKPTAGGVVSAVAVLGIVGSGLLYAWRLGAGSAID